MKPGESIRIPELIYRAICFFLTVFALWNVVNPLDPMIERALFVGLLILIVYLQSLMKPNRSAMLRALDLLLILATVVSYGYIIWNVDLMEDLGLFTPTEAMVLGFVAIVVILEATRRSMGWALTILISAFLLYIYYGEHLPFWLGGHMGFGNERIMGNLYLSTNGMFGVIAHVMLKYVFLFYLFGKLLEWTGALDFIMKLALALVGRYRGGPAMVAVMSSGFTGTISGSAVANVMITGTVTIPLMKRVGIKPHVAGGIEAAASSGGQFMPPVMGATAFLIAQFLGISYFEVMKAALIPAILYFVGVLVGVYAYAVRAKLKPIPPEEIPSWREVFGGSSGITFLNSFATLVILLLLRYSAPFAVLYSMAAGLACYAVIRLFQRKSLRVGSFVNLVSTAPAGFAGLGASAAGVGLIVAVLLLTGLAGRFSTLILNFAGDNVIMILIFTMIAAVGMGAGMPTSIIYILLALVLGPALEKLGILPLAAHLFIFYGGLMSMVTPPVAMAAYAGATLAGTDFWRTGVQAFIFSLSAYFLPFVFVLDNGLLMMGPIRGIVFAAVTGLAGVSLLSISLVGPAKDSLEYIERSLLFVAAVALLLPIPGSDLLAAALAFLGFLRPIRRRLVTPQKTAPAQLH
jgi:TRAP transporter 4TM/12TM fusion protein